MDEVVNSLDKKFIPMLERIREMFLEYGIKTLNMDDISRKLGISKKTLYRFVDNKESLIGKIFELEKYKWDLFFQQLSVQSLNAIEKLFQVSLRVHEEMKNLNPKMVFELKKYYEPLFNEYIFSNRSQIQKRMSLNLEQGISEGLYRSDVNVEVTVALYINSLVEAHNYSTFKNVKLTYEQVFEVMFDHHIRAISTPEGITYYERRKTEIFKDSNHL